MTEVGVDEVVGWQAARSVAKWTDRTAAKWTSVAEAAARQSRRTWWPTVTGPASTADVVTRIRAADVCVVLHESASEPIAMLDWTGAGEVLVIVGPEGGISDDELAFFVAAGARPTRLGETVLRSSTAGVAALAVIASRTRWT
jgi:16S rRNA (uracil1498-N3)-methyltransferase